MKEKKQGFGNKAQKTSDFEPREPRFIPDEIICGRIAVSAALDGDRPMNCVYIDKNISSPAMAALAGKAKAASVIIKSVTNDKLNSLCPGANHQGVAVSMAAHEYRSVEDMLSVAESRGEAPLLIICELEDPHNLGAVIRTAEAAGAHGVIIPERRSVALTGAVAKAACGALESVPVARVTNLTDTVKSLKEKGVWIYGADAGGQNWCTADYSGGAALVIGSEGRGISRLLRESCDLLVSLPMLGKISSLNASVAAGVILYEIVRQRQGISAAGK